MLKDADTDKRNANKNNLMYNNKITIIKKAEYCVACICFDHLCSHFVMADLRLADMNAWHIIMVSYNIFICRNHNVIDEYNNNVRITMDWCERLQKWIFISRDRDSIEVLPLHITHTHTSITWQYFVFFFSFVFLEIHPF